MEDERRQIKEYFDSVGMTEEFRQRLLALPRAEKTAPRAVSTVRRWRPALIAAAVCLVCLAAIPLLRQPALRSPEQPAASRAADPTRTEQPPDSAAPETESLLPVTPTGSEPAGPVESTAETDPPLHVDPTDPVLPTDPLRPVTEPIAPVADPTQPVTEPTTPVTEPPPPVTDPSEPATEPPPPNTEPSEPVTEPPSPDTEPSEPVTEPTAPPDTEPTPPDTSENPPDDPAPEGPAEIPAEDLGWTWALLRTEEGDLLRITDAAGAVCTLDLTGRLDGGTVIETCLIFGQERTLLLCPDGNGNWRLLVEEAP